MIGVREVVLFETNMDMLQIEEPTKHSSCLCVFYKYYNASNAMNENKNIRLFNIFKSYWSFTSVTWYNASNIMYSHVSNKDTTTTTRSRHEVTFIYR